MHSTVILSAADEEMFRRLGVNLTCEPKYEARSCSTVKSPISNPSAPKRRPGSAARAGFFVRKGNDAGKTARLQGFVGLSAAGALRTPS